MILLRAGGVKSAACFFNNFSTAAVLCYSLLLTLSLSRCPKKQLIFFHKKCMRKIDYDMVIFALAVCGNVFIP